MINFNDYQQGARETAIYPESAEVTYPLIGLGDEVGEVMGAYKKYLRGDYSSKEMEKRMKAELGDVLWYLANLADDLGLNLEEIAFENLKKLQTRKAKGVLRGDGDNR